MSAIVLAVMLAAALPGETAAVRPPATLDAAAAARFATLALDCVAREYPDKIAHVLSRDDGRAAAPRLLTPAFYGCYDWHSAVHGHWLLARLARTFPSAPFAAPARAALARSLTPANVAGEVAYIRGKGRTIVRAARTAWPGSSSSRPSCGSGTTRTPRAWSARSGAPRGGGGGAVRAVAAQAEPAHPRRRARPDGVRVRPRARLGRGGGAREHARSGGEPARATSTSATATARCAYEPSGQDFLSPCLAEADLVRRLLPPARFAAWLSAFLPTLDSPIRARPGFRRPW